MPEAFVFTPKLFTRALEFVVKPPAGPCGPAGPAGPATTVVVTKPDKSKVCVGALVRLKNTWLFSSSGLTIRV